MPVPDKPIPTAKFVGTVPTNGITLEEPVWEAAVVKLAVAYPVTACERVTCKLAGFTFVMNAPAGIPEPVIAWPIAKFVKALALTVMTLPDVLVSVRVMPDPPTLEPPINL